MTDSVTTEVIKHGLTSAALQMSIALRRTAFSPLIYDVLDFSTTLFDRQVRVLAQGQGLPFHIGATAASVEASVRAVGGEEVLRPGDVLFNTYGYDLGSHPQDAAVIVPVFAAEALVGYAAVRAHHMDLAALAPYCTDTTDNFQEGTIFPGVFVYRAGELREDMYRTIVANSRMPAALVGDLNAQIVAASTGERALVRLVERFGRERFAEAVEQIFDHGETLVRRFLAEVPDGRYVAQGALDSDGVVDGQVPFEIAVEVTGGDILVDFTGAPAARGGPVNSPIQVTTAAARLAVITVATRGAEPANEGQFRPITVRTTPGTLFEPMPPAPIYLCGNTVGIALDVIHRALAQALPHRVPAGNGGDVAGSMCWGTSAGGRFWTTATSHSTGQGATAGRDGGPPLMHIFCSGMVTNSIEVTEQRGPLVFRRWELAQDSGGAGCWRGGPGLDSSYQLREDASLTCVMERTKIPPWGLAGGGFARANSMSVELPDGSVAPIAKSTANPLPAGTTIHARIGGGGGHGPPAGREPARVHEDVRDGYVSPDAARRDYPQAFR